MALVKTTEEIEKIRKSASLVEATLAEVTQSIRPGVSLHHLNQIAEEYIQDMGATPSFKGYGGFPGALCLSPNQQVVHGIPSEYELREGDVLSVDCGVYHDGYHGDSAYTFAIGEIAPEAYSLLVRTKQSLYEGIAQVRENARLGDIGFAIQNATQGKYGYGVVKELVGHGLGAELHEEPQVPNYGKRGNGRKLKAGMVIAIEPMINLGLRQIVFHDDGWTVTTKDNKVSAHYEHDVAVTKDGADILSSFAKIEEAEKKNQNLTPVSEKISSN